MLYQRQIQNSPTLPENGRSDCRSLSEIVLRLGFCSLRNDRIRSSWSVLDSSLPVWKSWVLDLAVVVQHEGDPYSHLFEIPAHVQHWFCQQMPPQRVEQTRVYEWSYCPMPPLNPRRSKHFPEGYCETVKTNWLVDHPARLLCRSISVSEAETNGTGKKAYRTVPYRYSEDHFFYRTVPYRTKQIAHRTVTARGLRYTVSRNTVPSADLFFSLEVLVKPSTNVEQSQSL